MKQHLGHALVKGATPKLSRDPNFVVDEAIGFIIFSVTMGQNWSLHVYRNESCRFLPTVHPYIFNISPLSPSPWKIRFFQKKKNLQKKSNFFWQQSHLEIYIFWSLWKHSPLLMRTEKSPVWDNFQAASWVSPKSSSREIGSFGMRMISKVPENACRQVGPGDWKTH